MIMPFRRARIRTERRMPILSNFHEVLTIFIRPFFERAPVIKYRGYATGSPTGIILNLHSIARSRVLSL